MFHRLLRWDLCEEMLAFLEDRCNDAAKGFKVPVALQLLNQWSIHLEELRKGVLANHLTAWKTLFSSGWRPCSLLMLTSQEVCKTETVGCCHVTKFSIFPIRSCFLHFLAKIFGYQEMNKRSDPLVPSTGILRYNPNLACGPSIFTNLRRKPFMVNPH